MGEPVEIDITAKAVRLDEVRDKNVRWQWGHTSANASGPPGPQRLASAAVGGLVGSMTGTVAYAPSSLLF